MTTRTDALRAAVIAGGVTPARADQIVARIAAVAKKQRRAKLPRLNRDRKAITAARAALTTTLSKFFVTAARDIAKQVTKARKALDASVGKADAADETEKKAKAIIAGIDFAKWKSVQPDIADIIARITQDGVSVAFDQVGIEAGSKITDQANADAIDWARDRAAALVGMTYNDDGELVSNPDPDMAITEGTRAMLRSAVTDAIDEGLSTNQLADLLEEDFAFSGARAERIARFELAQADIQGNLIAYRRSGVVAGKEVILGSEHNDPDECDEAADMGVVPLDDDFDGNGDPPYHPGCVCDLVVTLADDEDE